MRSFAIRLMFVGAAAASLVPAMALAITCQPTFVSPAICHPAHADAPTQHPSGGDCTVDGMGQCVPTTGTRCIDRYAAAVAGACEFKLNYHNPTGCTWNYGVTVVDLPKYLAACSSDSGTCQCEYSRDSMTTPSQVQVCECDEQPL